MTTPHSDVAAELWSLAETVLNRLEPLLAQSVRTQEDSPRQGCSWCPVCALAALIRGEQHDLVTLLASEGSTVIALIRQLISEHAASTGSGASTGSAASTGPAGPPPFTASPADPADGPLRDRSGGGRGTASAGDDHPEESMIRRAAFEPITVTVKDPTASGPHD